MLPFQTAEAQAIFCLPFAHRANRSLSFDHLFTKKQTELIHFQTN